MKSRFLPLALFLILSSAVFSQVWTPKAEGTLPSNYNVSDISIVSDQVIWATAYDFAEIDSPVSASHSPKTLKTTNGGDTWEVQDVEEAAGTIAFDIHAIDEFTAFLTTNSQSGAVGNGLFKTTDGGVTWTKVVFGDAGGVWLHFFDGQEGICINANIMRRTTNGGQTWTNVSGVPAFLPGEGTFIWTANTSLCAVGNTLWFGTSKGRIFKSINKGISWIASNSGLGTSASIFSVAFVDAKNGLALYSTPSSTSSKLAKSTDGGATWIDLNNTNGFEEIIALPCSKLFMGVSFITDITFTSSDFGGSWSMLDNQVAALTPTFLSPGLGWASNGSPTGANPALYKWTGGPLTGRTFVNQNANGANNGSSWADAYTDLKTALESAEAGDEIWVAEGTYKPAAPGGNSTSTFLIDKNLKLYGGFAGAECNLSERDIVLHPTILSGDLNGDDVLDDFVTNRGDNVMTVMTVTAAVTNETVVDGFTISNGHADGTQFNQQGLGGAVYSNGSPHFKQCSFTQNYAFFSGGAFQQNATSGEGLFLEDCFFEKNLANYGAGARMDDTKFLVDNCTFQNNTTFDGTYQANTGGLSIVNSSGTVRKCFFIDNQAFEYSGGMSIWNPSGTGNSEVEVLDCTFTGNSSNSGVGGLSFLSFGNNTTYTAKRCTFIGNSSPNGGGISISCNNASNNTSFLVDSCSFSQNIVEFAGSAIATRLAGKNVKVEVKNSLFTANGTNGEAAVDFWGTDGGTGTAIMDNCVFENNSSVYSGALEIGNGHNGGASVNYTLTNSTFLSNEAMEGGAIGLWSDTLSTINISVEKCLIDNNKGTVDGGGITFYPLSNNYHAVVKNSYIINNDSPEGGAIYSYIFTPGTSVPANASILLENCLIAGNTGGNAAISVDSMPNLQFLNCTIANNNGDGIQLSDQSHLTLQNTILANPGHTEYTASANSTVTSLGGNLIGDNSLMDYALSYDLQNTDPLFGTGYHLSNSSPAIDKGVDLGNLSEFDLDGNARVNGCVDIGAYESDVVVSMECVTGSREVLAGSLMLAPNPAADFLNIQLPDAITGPNEIGIFDAQGRLMERQSFTEGQAIQVGHLPGGFYSLKLMAGQRVYVGKFVKQ